MPRYELMYLLGSNVAENEVPNVTAEVLKAIEDLGGTSVVENQIGKKKLAYPIKKTRNGHYVAVTFSMEPSKVKGLNAKIKTMDDKLIRHILINLEEHLGRMEKDKQVQAKMTPRKPQKEVKTVPAEPKKAPAPLVEINQAELDKKIEEALTEDLTK